MVKSFSLIEDAAKAAELAEGPDGRRIVKVFYSGEKHPDIWIGLYGGAPIEYGPEGYCFSDGETVTVTD